MSSSGPKSRNTATHVSRSSYDANKHRSICELVAFVPPQHDILEMTIAEILCYAPVEFPRMVDSSPSSVVSES